MNRSLYNAALAIGLATVLWVGAGYVPGSPLAALLVALIAAFFLMGTLELRQFRKSTAALDAALDRCNSGPADLETWLSTLPVSLRQAVRLRAEGERVALPGPALTPYLAGLLVLLGMLGTFLGMVVTLKGTGLALENASDVEAIRASLAAPVKGLGLAFGCSVAGVAASAMLGLMSALARRERLHSSQSLDSHLATTLRSFTRAHQRDESLRLLRLQADALPALVEQLQVLVARVDHRGQALHDGLLASQAKFQDEARRTSAELAASVGHSLQTSLAEGPRLAAAALAPAVQKTLDALAQQAGAVQQQLAQAVQRQLDGTGAQLGQAVDTLSARWQGTWDQALDRQRAVHDALAQQAHAASAAVLAGFERHAQALRQSVERAHADLNEAAAQRETERQGRIVAALESSARLITTQAQAQAQATLDEIGRLVQTAAEAPRAAADLIGEMRRSFSESLVRDQAVLDERQHLLGTLGKLLDAVNHASTQQRSAVDALVKTTDEVLGRAGARFAETVDAQSLTLQGLSAQVAGSAAEVASLGEGFGHAVQLFGQASERLLQQLQGIEAALGQSMARSDEQLAYYVAQAREIVDLTLGSHKQMVDDLQHLGRAPPAQGRARAEADAA